MMSALDVNMPVTLVVKAPNQKIADQTVECALGWTIRKLKAHLSSIYPNRPEQHQQKLIYSGKLLKDHLMLKDVLRQYDESTTHTVHLVCSGVNNGSESSSTNSQESASNSRIPVNENTTPATSMTPPPNTDGLRHRDTQSMPTSMTHPYANQFYGATSTPMAMPQYTQMNAFSPYGGAMNPQQLYWMQQMYAQQMTQYMQMQYMQQGMQQTPVSQAMPDTPQPAAPPIAQPANNAPANNNRPQANPNIVMNAQGGAMLDDEEEGNQDWLDWFYTLCRIGVLMSIVYFYSSISRAILGFGFFLLMYLYQIGWFRLQRRNIEPRPPVAPVQPEPPQPALQPERPQQENNESERSNETDTDENDGGADGDSDTSATTESQEPPQEPQTPQPNVLEVTWIFVKTFFTSLMPAQPPVINAN